MAKKNQMFFIEEDDVKQFKMNTTENNTNMSEVVGKFIKQYNNHHEKNKK